MTCKHTLIFVQTSELSIVTCTLCGLAASGKTMEIAKKKFESFSNIKPRRFLCEATLDIEVEADSLTDAHDTAERILQDRLDDWDVSGVSVHVDEA